MSGLRAFRIVVVWTLKFSTLFGRECFLSLIIRLVPTRKNVRRLPGLVWARQANIISYTIGWINTAMSIQNKNWYIIYNDNTYLWFRPWLKIYVPGKHWCVTLFIKPVIACRLQTIHDVITTGAIFRQTNPCIAGKLSFKSVTKCSCVDTVVLAINISYQCYSVEHKICTRHQVMWQSKKLTQMFAPKYHKATCLVCLTFRRSSFLRFHNADDVYRPT